VLDQSIDIMQWALRQNDPDKWFSDMNNPESDILIERNDAFFKQALDRFKYPSRYPNIQSDDAIKMGLEILNNIDTRLKNNNLTLGDNMQFAEIAIFPFIRQFASVDKNWFDTLPLNPNNG
jgi:glutathione S-transferase